MDVFVNLVVVMVLFVCVLTINISVHFKCVQFEHEKTPKRLKQKKHRQHANLRSLWPASTETRAQV